MKKINLLSYDKEMLRHQIIQALKLAKKEVDSRCTIKYEMGIDLANYENKYFTALQNLLEFLLEDDKKDDIAGSFVSWWLFETVDKTIYDKDDSRIDDLTTAENFVDYMLGKM